MGRIPKIINRPKILIICEGCEEFDYLNRLKSLDVWSHKFSIDLKNAKSIDNIMGVYQYYYQSNSYKAILILCDTEKDPFQQFKSLINKMYEFHGKYLEQEIIYFANPCTMQIILSHFDEIKLFTSSKSDNAELIKRLTGVGNYRATENQRDSIMKKINSDNYSIMKNNIAKLNTKYTIIPSTNCLTLFNKLESDDAKWINILNKKLS